MRTRFPTEVSEQVRPNMSATASEGHSTLAMLMTVG